jgi:ferredoxin
MAEAQIHEYAVSEDCIACDACCDDFPAIFKMDDDHTRAEAYAPIKEGIHNPWDIITVCPVDAISLVKGVLPPPPENLQEKEAEEAPLVLEDNRPWQVRWEEAKDHEESEWERMKRYGLAYTMEESLDQYQFRFAMPEEVPNHQFKFVWGLPNKMPDYENEVRLDGKRLFVKCMLKDKRVAKLCDVANSFPDRFIREIALPQSGKEVSVNYSKESKILDVVVTKDQEQVAA